MQVVVAPKLVSETRVESIDLSSLLAVGQAASSATCVVVVYSGTDAAPPSFTAGVSTTTLSLTLTGGVLGVIYSVRALITTTGPVANLPVTFYLAVIPDLP